MGNSQQGRQLLPIHIHESHRVHLPQRWHAISKTLRELNICYSDCKFQST